MLNHFIMKCDKKFVLKHSNKNVIQLNINPFINKIFIPLEQIGKCLGQNSRAHVSPDIYIH